MFAFQSVRRIKQCPSGWLPQSRRNYPFIILILLLKRILASSSLLFSLLGHLAIFPGLLGRHSFYRKTIPHSRRVYARTYILLPGFLIFQKLAKNSLAFFFFFFFFFSCSFSPGRGMKLQTLREDIPRQIQQYGAMAIYLWYNRLSSPHRRIHVHTVQDMSDRRYLSLSQL